MFKKPLIDNYGFTQHYFFSLKKSSAGFTLLELLVAMGIFTLVILAGAWLLISGFRYNTIIWNQLEGQKDGRQAVQRVVDFVRRTEQSSIGSHAIVLAEDNELIIYTNTDSDSFVEKVRFWLDGTTLKMGTVKPSGNPLGYAGVETTVELAHYVVNLSEGVPTFIYFDENYTGIEDPLETPADTTLVKLIKIQLEIEKDPEKTPVPLHVESMVGIRNLKGN
ncbi:MAG: prepilin-type N-terminal cleavage/methylation domain-containing protein [Candidatus Magasanikbacteria bacterium]